MPVPEANGCTVGSSRQRLVGEAELRAPPRARTTFCGSIGNVVGRAGSSPRRRDLLHERRLVLLQVVEERAHLGRLHPALEVVEHDVVRLVADLEAVDVALAQVEVLAQRRQERREVVVPARLDPDRVRERRGARHLRAQLGGHLARLLPVARPRRGSGSPRTSRSRGSRPKARSSSSSRPTSAEVNFSCAIRPSVASCSARSGAPRGGIITCWSQPRSAIVLPRSADLGQALAQLVERRLARTHGRETYMSGPAAELRSRSAARRGGSEDDPPSGSPGHGDDGGRGLYPPPAGPQLRQH